MNSVTKPVTPHRSEEMPFSKLLPEGKFVTHKVLLSVNLSQSCSAVTAIICNSYPLKILFVASTAKTTTAVRALCAALLTPKRQFLPLSWAVFSQSVKNVHAQLPGKKACFQCGRVDCTWDYIWAETVGVEP